MRGLSLVAASGGHSSSRCAGLSLSQPLLLWGTGSRRAGSAVVAHGPSCSAACGIFPDQGSNPCPLHWQVDSQPLRHQGSPKLLLSVVRERRSGIQLRALPASDTSSSGLLPKTLLPSLTLLGHASQAGQVSQGTVVLFPGLTSGRCGVGLPRRRGLLFYPPEHRQDHPQG